MSDAAGGAVTPAATSSHQDHLATAAQELRERHRIADVPPRPVPVWAQSAAMERWASEIGPACRKAEPQVSKAAEWLLDNLFQVHRTLREVVEDLPTEFYRRLPSLLNPGEEGLPRTLSLAHGIRRPTGCNCHAPLRFSSSTPIRKKAPSPSQSFGPSRPCCGSPAWKSWSRRPASCSRMFSRPSAARPTQARSIRSIRPSASHARSPDCVPSRHPLERVLRSDQLRRDHPARRSRGRLYRTPTSRRAITPARSSRRSLTERDEANPTSPTGSSSRRAGPGTTAGAAMWATGSSTMAGGNRGGARLPHAALSRRFADGCCAIQPDAMSPHLPASLSRP